MRVKASRAKSYLGACVRPEGADAHPGVRVILGDSRQMSRPAMFSHALLLHPCLNPSLCQILLIDGIAKQAAEFVTTNRFGVLVKISLLGYVTKHCGTTALKDIMELQKKKDRET